MSIWTQMVSVEDFAARHPATLPSLLGIPMLEIGPDLSAPRCQ